MRLTYDRTADTAYVRLHDAPSIDHSEALDADRRVDYADGEPVGGEFLHVQRGVRTDGLPTTLLAAASVIGPLAQLLQSIDAPSAQLVVPEADEAGERRMWSRLGLRSLAREWDTEADRLYDRLR